MRMLETMVSGIPLVLDPRMEPECRILMFTGPWALNQPRAHELWIFHRLDTVGEILHGHIYTMLTETLGFWPRKSCRRPLQQNASQNLVNHGQQSPCVEPSSPLRSTLTI